MAENYGLLTNLATGIREGMLAYQTTKQMQRQNQMNNLMNGMQENKETGQLEFTPEMQRQRQMKSDAEMANHQRTIDSRNPNSGYAQEARGLLSGAGYKIPDATTPDTIKEFSGLLTADRKADASLESNNLRNLMKSQQAQKMNEKNIEGLNQYDDAITALEDIKAAYKEDFVGPVRGMMPGVVVGPEEDVLRKRIGRNTDAYRKLITGAGAGNAELKMIESRLPNIQDKPANFISNIDDLINIYGAQRERYLGGLDTLGKDTSKARGLLRSGGTATPAGKAPQKTAAPLSFEEFQKQKKAAK